MEKATKNKYFFNIIEKKHIGSYPCAEISANK
jgi:hypothetical protein